MNNQVHSALSGTQTHKNLTDAFAGEARSAARYRIFANTAKENGDAVLAQMLENIAKNETEHAELWMRYLGEIGNTVDNLDNLTASEEYETGVMYPEYAKTAAEEGFSEIAEKMNMAAKAESGHMKLLKDYAEKMRNGSLYSGDEDTEWLCTNCGYTHTGAQAPERCPLCSYPGSYYVQES